MSICLAVSTYKKNAALTGWLESVPNFGQVSIIHIADDNDGEAKPVAEKFQEDFERGDYPYPIVYSTGPNKGIACNKNRSISFFLNAPEAASCKYLVMSDDDIHYMQSETGERFLGDLLIKASKESDTRHITGYLGGAFGKVNDDGSVTGLSDSFFTQFPPLAEDNYLVYCKGTQGILLFFERELVTKLGYFARFPGKYGYEHANYSARAARLEGKCPDLFPVLKHCNKYFLCQGIPNNYEAKPQENTATYGKYQQLTYQGIDLACKSSGV
jgi:hypothetical protein